MHLQQNAAFGLLVEAPQGNWLHTETMNDCVIKATQQPDGSKMYRTPQCSTYAETIVLQSQGGQWFCTQDAAENAGYALANDCE